jgi:hypothetical protein
MTYRIAQVSVARYPVLNVTFTDGLSGEYDLSEMIADGLIFEPLRDPSYFAQVAVAPYGQSFGWNLQDEGHEIDFCPDTTRIQIEDQKVAELADHYRASRSAAE